ncbi:zf-C2H2 domain-containing protein/zf-C2H2_4 domain-containing protein, partial [Cephalotus follicularis]
VPLSNLSTVKARMDSVQRFLTESVNSSTIISRDEMETVSSEISSAIHQIIINGAALISRSQTPISNNTSKKEEELVKMQTQLKAEEETEESGGECDIVELDAVELLAEHIHFCEICGKGFKRDANLRMHMRAHGNQFKTPEALAKPLKMSGNSKTMTRTRFSCPFEGCNRNKKHKKFRPLKSVICVRNHFKRSHCPKMYSCNRCNKKSFSVVADLKSHLKHCGESKWKCSCGTSFSRKDKLFGHMALFEGHMPAVEEEVKDEVVPMEEDEDEDEEEHISVKGGGGDVASLDDGLFFDGLLDGFGSTESYCLQDVLGS